MTPLQAKMVDVQRDVRILPNGKFLGCLYILDQKRQTHRQVFLGAHGERQCSGVSWTLLEPALAPG